MHAMKNIELKLAKLFCFALLFLKRANFVADLTENLKVRMVIRDPGAK